MADLIRAEMQGDNKASAAGITAVARAPVLALCRKLVAAGHDPASPLHAYRGETLALTVRSIGEGAKLRVSESSTEGRPRFRPYEGMEEPE